MIQFLRRSIVEPPLCTPPPSPHRHLLKPAKEEKRSLFWPLLGGVTLTSIASLLALGILYQLISAPPLELWYSVRLPPAGQSSIYVPGSGFSGFWFHLGLLQGNLAELPAYDYYCYSSGCLSVMLTFLNVSLDSVADVGLNLQAAWKDGNLTSYDLVENFVDQVLPEHDTRSEEAMQEFLPRIKVLLTTANHGVQVRTASNRQELVDLMIKTTWIPFVTGGGLYQQETAKLASNETTGTTDDTVNDFFLDGGFSRRLHPKCQYELRVPTTWSTTIHTLNPGFNKERVYEFWNMGRLHPFSPLQAQQAIPTTALSNNIGTLLQ